MAAKDEADEDQPRLEVGVLLPGRGRKAEGGGEGGPSGDGCWLFWLWAASSLAGMTKGSRRTRWPLEVVEPLHDEEEGEEALVFGFRGLPALRDPSSCRNWLDPGRRCGAALKEPSADDEVD